MTQAQQRPEFDEMTTFPPPGIHQASPDYGRVGDTVTVKGSNLRSVDKCTFQVGQDTRRGEIVQTPGDDQVKVRIPRDLPTGNGQISVSNATGESNRLGFTVQP